MWRREGSQGRGISGNPGKPRMDRPPPMRYTLGMNWERVEQPEQVAAVAALAREIWTRHYTPLIGSEQVEYMLEKFQSVEAITRQMETDGVEYVWVPDAGYAAWVPDLHKKSLFLSKIYVKKDQRGTGLGRALLKLAEARARELGCTELWLTVNRHNTGTIAFYERMGLQKTNELVQEIGGGFVMDDWRMAKSIAVSTAFNPGNQDSGEPSDN